MNRKSIAAVAIIATAAFFTVSGCKREPAAAPEAAVAPEAEPAAPDAMTAETAPAANAAPAADPTATLDDALDVKGFAGHFSGAGMQLALQPDGSFALDRGAAGTVEGTWTAEESDTRIRLDPNSKSEPDRVYAIASHDQLAPLGNDGMPVAGSDQALNRDAP